MQPAADERRARVAESLAVGREVLDALRGAADDGRGGLDQRLVEVVHDRALLGVHGRDELARDVGRAEVGLVDEKQFLFDTEREVGLEAEAVLHGAQVYGRGGQ